MHTKHRVIASSVKEPPPGLWSNCVVVGEVVYVSGMTARGPDPEVIRGLGDKIEARRIALAVGAPLVLVAGAALHGRGLETLPFAVAVAVDELDREHRPADAREREGDVEGVRGGGDTHERLRNGKMLV